MSQRNVERVVGRLVLDEGLRERFRADRGATVAALVRQGIELTAVETEALAALSLADLDHLARAVDPRLQQASLSAAVSAPPTEGENRR